MTAASQIVTHAAQVMVDGRVGVVVAVNATVGDDVEAGKLLVAGDGADRVF